MEGKEVAESRPELESPGLSALGTPLCSGFPPAGLAVYSHLPEGFLLCQHQTGARPGLRLLPFSPPHSLAGPSCHCSCS